MHDNKVSQQLHHSGSHHQGMAQGLCLCERCQLTVSKAHQQCPRCEYPLRYRRVPSVQHSWALLLTAAILLIPANIYPITILTSQGKIAYDTIFTGIAHLVHLDMIPIAIIVFTASIAVPWLKIIGLALFLLAIHYQLPLPKSWLMRGFHFIEWIGRWSMLDLFVITITVAVVNMGQLMDAKPGPAATAFALVILLTQLAAKVLDTRLLWDKINLSSNNMSNKAHHSAAISGHNK